VGNFNLPVRVSATGGDHFTFTHSGKTPLHYAFLVQIDPDGRTLRFARHDNVIGSVEMALPTRTDTLDADYSMDFGAQGLRVSIPPRDSTQRPLNLPINKPPYGTLVAIDLSTGAQRWNVTLGDTHAIRNHPLLKSLNLPPLGVAGSPGPMVTAGGVIFVTGGGFVLYAIDTRDGAILWQSDLGQAGYSVPMTYRTKAGKQFVVVATGAAQGAKLAAFALP